MFAIFAIMTVLVRYDLRLYMEFQLDPINAVTNIKIMLSEHISTKKVSLKTKQSITTLCRELVDPGS